MSRDLLISRGPFTFQWRVVPPALMSPRPMDRDRSLPQVAVLRGVPEGLTVGDVMRVLERCIWVPGLLGTSVTEYQWEALPGLQHALGLLGLRGRHAS